MSENAFWVYWWLIMILGAILLGDGKDGYDLVDSLSIWLRK